MRRTQLAVEPAKPFRIGGDFLDMAALRALIQPSDAADARRHQGYQKQRAVAFRARTRRDWLRLHRLLECVYSHAIFLRFLIVMRISFRTAGNIPMVKTAHFEVKTPKRVAYQFLIPPMAPAAISARSRVIVLAVNVSTGGLGGLGVFGAGTFAGFGAAADHPTMGGLKSISHTPSK
jgi:hypothetical protein